MVGINVDELSLVGINVDILDELYFVMDKKDLHSIEELSAEIEAYRNESVKRGRIFSTLTPDQILEKLRSSTTPFITTVASTGRGPANASFFFEIYVKNPDSRIHSDICAYFFFGPAHLISDPGIALISVDQKLYHGHQLFSPIFPNTTSSVVFNYTFPAGISLGAYIGNAFIFEREVPISPIYERYNISVEITQP